MGLFDSLFKKPKAAAEASSFYKTLTAYQPVFRTFGGSLYESELIRTAIDARARHMSKLMVQFQGAANKRLHATEKSRPNSFQTWSQFLYRLSTILDMQNTAFIVPVFDDEGTIEGYFPVLPTRCAMVEYNGKPWLKYSFDNAQTACVELSECGIMNKFQYHDDFFGENNMALHDTMNLIAMQHQGIEEGIKNSATFRFMARVTNFTKPDDLEKERKRFNAISLQGESGGVLLFPNTYSDIHQVQSTPYAVDAGQMKLIQERVYTYFGVNDDILQNKAIGDALEAFFEGAIEPFAIQLSDVLTNMTFTKREIASGNRVAVAANRLGYMSNASKITMAKEMGDRGILTVNEIRALFNYEPLPDDIGNHCPARGEYYFTDERNDENADEN